MNNTKPYKTNKPLQNNGLFVSEAVSSSDGVWICL